MGKKVKIYNPSTGETKIVDESELATYGAQTMPQGGLPGQNGQPASLSPQNATLEPIDQPQTQPQQGGFIENILRSAAKPFINTAKNIVGAPIEAARAFTLGNQEQNINQNTRDQQDLVKKILAEKDPKKRAEYVKQSRSLSNTGQQERAGIDKVAGFQNPVLNGQDFENIHNDPRGYFNQQVKDSAEVASYGVPFGKGANFVTKTLLPGAVVGGINAATEDNANPYSVGAGALTGAAGAGVLGGLLKIPGLIGKVGEKVSGKADSLSNTLLRSQYNLLPKDAQRLSINETVKALKEYGIKNINDVTTIAPQITGNDGIVNLIKQRAIEQAGPVDTAGIRKVAEDLLGQSSLIPNYVKKNIKNQLTQTLVKAGENNLSGAEAGRVFRLIQDFESQAVDLAAGNDPIAKQTAKVYQGIANELKDRLFEGINGKGQKVAGGANDVLLKGDVIRPEDIQALEQINPTLADRVLKAKTVADLRAIEKPFVRASRAAGISESRTGNQIFGSRGMVRGAMAVLNPHAAPAIATEAALETPGGKTFASNMLDKVASATAPKLEGGRELNPALKNILFQGASRNPLGLSNASPDQVNGSYDTNNIPDNQSTPSIPQQTASATGYTLEELGQGYTKALQAGDNAAATEIKKLYDLEESFQKQAKPGELTAAQQARHDNLQTALSSLDAAENNLVGAGGAKGPLGLAALIPGLGQVVDPSGAAYHSTKIELATQLAKAITGGSRPAGSVIQQYLHSLPDVNDTPKYAAEKIKKLRNELMKQAESFKYDDLLQAYQ